MPQAERKAAVVRELSLVYAAVAAVTLAVSYTSSWLTRDYGHLILAATFLTLALYGARKSGRSAAAYGIDLAGLLEAHPDEQGNPERLPVTLRRALPSMLRELGWALLVAGLVFPLFVLGFRVWHGVEGPFTLHLPSAFVDFMLGQLLVVALPEEALFRGYFQTRLRDLFPRTVRVLGAEISPLALVCQALLFALLHFLVGFSPARLSVFFPALLFGLMRDVRSGIGAAVWFHAFSNLLSELLARGYF
jgi:membrane protease YdiL (CAAX protease family)